MNAARKTMQKTSPRVYTVYTAQTIQSCDIHVFGESSGIHMLWEMFAYSHTWLQRSPNHVNRASFPHVANIQGPWHHYCSIYVFIVAHLKRWLSLTLNHLDCSFQQNFTARRKLEDSKSVIQPFGHVSGKIWTSMFRVRPFPPFSAFFCPLNFSFFMLVYLCFSSWKQFLSYSLPLPFGNMLQMPKSNKQFQWDSILWAMTVSLTDFSHAAATPPVLSYLHYWDLELDLAKALRSQVLKSKKCPLSFTHPRTI